MGSQRVRHDWVTFTFTSWALTMYKLCDAMTYKDCLGWSELSSMPCHGCENWWTCVGEWRQEQVGKPAGAFILIIFLPINTISFQPSLLLRMEWCSPHREEREWGREERQECCTQSWHEGVEEVINWDTLLCSVSRQSWELPALGRIEASSFLAQGRRTAGRRWFGFRRWWRRCISEDPC